MQDGRRLMVMRHSDAAGGGFDLPDAARPLTAEGRRRAGDRAALIRASAPDLIICSTAVRAAQTLEAMQPVGGRHVAEPRLYGADVIGVVLLLAEVDDDVDTVLLIGHLPTMSEVVMWLTGQPPIAFPPATVVELWTPPGAWSALSPGCAEVLAVHR